MATLSIIIISYNTRDLILQTLDSVAKDLRSHSQLAKATEVLIVDNNSNDDSVAAIKKWQQQHPALDVKLILNSKNQGFGRANNRAIQQAKGELIFFLNSDTIVKPGCLSALVQAFDDHLLEQSTADLSSYRFKLDRLGVLAASLMNPDGSQQAQGGSFPGLVSLFCHMTLLDDLPLIGQYLPSTQHTGRRSNQTLHAADKTDSLHLHQQDWVGATAMMIRQELIQEIGPFDQNIFMYGEDVELCLRAKNHHWDVAIHPGARVVHLGSASSSSKNAIIGEMVGYLYIWSKHKPLWQADLAKQILLLGARLRTVLFGTILGDPTKAEIYKEAIIQIQAQA